MEQMRRMRTELAKLSFRRELQSCRGRQFCIISSNCVGSLPYQILHIEYNTPTVGLFFYAPCFIRLVSSFSHYINQRLTFKSQSVYPEGNENLHKFGGYPLGMLGDVEVHFLHYGSEHEALAKWTERSKRVRNDNLFFVMTDRDLCSIDDLVAFDQLCHKNKVCFTAKDYGFDSSVPIRAFAGSDCVGDLYTNYSYLARDFKFGQWLAG
jgi:uncharacterized protein (DUF1919 family)